MPSDFRRAAAWSAFLSYLLGGFRLLRLENDGLGRKFYSLKCNSKKVATDHDFYSTKTATRSHSDGPVHKSKHPKETVYNLLHALNELNFAMTTMSASIVQSESLQSWP